VLTGTALTWLTVTPTMLAALCGPPEPVLSVLIYQPAHDYFGADTVQLTSTDNTGRGDRKVPPAVWESRSTTSTPVPVNTVPGSQTVNENGSLVFSSGGW